MFESISIDSLIVLFYIYIGTIIFEKMYIFLAHSIQLSNLSLYTFELYFVLAYKYYYFNLYCFPYWKRRNVKACEPFRRTTQVRHVNQILIRTFTVKYQIFTKISCYLRYNFMVPSVSPREFLETHLYVP